jgi:PAS domain S-box-containing protein
MSAVFRSSATADSPPGGEPPPHAAAQLPAPAAPRPAARPAALTSALDALGVMLLHVSVEGGVLGWNRAAREALGWTGGLPAGRLDPALAPDGAAALARRIAARGPATWDAAWPCADGRLLAVRVAVEVEAGPQGTRLLCCATARAPSLPGAAEIERLRQSHDLLFVHSPLPVCVQDASFRLVTANGAYCAMTGYPVSALVGRDPIFMVAPEQTDELLRLRADSGFFARMFAEGTTRTVERRYLRADGRPLLLRVHTRVVRDPRAGFLACTISEDLTADRSRVDDVLRDNEIFRLLFEESPSPKSIQDAGFRLLKVNRAYCEMFGYEAAELVGRDPIEWAASEDRDMILEQRQRALRGEHLPSTLTRRMLRKDGAMRICRLMRHTTYASDGSRIELITLHDETDEIRMQQRLRAYWQRFERFFEQAPVGLMICDATGRVALVNRALEDIVGRSRDRLIGSPDSLGDHGAVEAGRPGGRQRMTWTRDDGSTRWIDRTDRDLEDLDGRPMRLTVLHDVTRERNLREELIETEERFRQFAELVDDAIFVADPGLTQIQYVNTRFETIWGTSMTELLQRPRAIFDNVLPEHRTDVACLFDGQSLGAAHESVLQLQHPRLGVRSVRLRVYGEQADRPGVPPPADGASSARLFAVAEDITETLRLEQARLEDAIKQRDMLVREVHHRIKNNLQGVAGLLQQSASSRPELAEPLAEVVGRIQAIAQVHGLQVRDGEALVARRVVVAVFENLGRAFGLAMPVEVIDPDAVERWLLPEQEAVPLALVINELGTNAIKHRWPGAAVEVTLQSLPDGLALEIRSAGTLPAGFDIARLGPSPSGLGLVKALLPRRGARLDLTQLGDRVTARAELTIPALRERAAH